MKSLILTWQTPRTQNLAQRIKLYAQESVQKRSLIQEWINLTKVNMIILPIGITQQ
jgi:hypothetical protein